MAGRETATPGSSNMDTSTPAHKTPKDRRCPYCNELFTSSSLGRHLDQFIKEDKPKPPDGKHIVEEIQKLRGGVTRRQARISSAKRDLATASVYTPDDGASPPTKRARLQVANLGGWNQASLESTGVLPSLAGRHSNAYLGNGSKVDLDRKLRQAQAERDDGRAAKLALIEILDNLKAAKAQNAPSSPFSFDFLAQSFPSLVLLVLPGQPTLLSSQLIPSAKGWPIDFPTKTHFEALRRLLSTRLDEFAVERRAARHQRDSEDSIPSNSSQDTNQSNFDVASYHDHLSNAYNVWASLSDQEKQRQYHVEFARAFIREQDSHSDTKAKLEAAEQKLAHQDIQIKRLNELQQPREFLKSPVTPMPYTSEITKIVESKFGLEHVPAADELIAKWRPSVKENPGFQKGVEFYNQLYEASGLDGEVNGATDGLAREPDADVNGLTSNGTGPGAPTDMHGMDLDGGDSVDASGEDDDEAEVIPPATNSRSTNIHGLHGLDTLIDPNLNSNSDMRDTGDFGAAELLADLEQRKKMRR